MGVAPKIVSLNVELELKSEKENAEVRIDSVEDYQKIVDAEWDIIYDKLDKIAASGAPIQSTVHNLIPEVLGSCGCFEERQVGDERYNIFTECPATKTATIVLRGGAEQFIEEAERSLHDAIMIVRRTLQNNVV